MTQLQRAEMSCVGNKSNIIKQIKKFWRGGSPERFLILLGGTLQIIEIPEGMVQ